jgi:DNA-binding NarL/FixJ family response regulator
MLALVVARPGPVRDGLVALLEAAPDVRKIVQIAQANDALDFVQTISPDITLIHATPHSSELGILISRMKRLCRCPLLAIVDSEEDRKTAVAQGADDVVLEGLPAVKLATHITLLLHQNSDIQKRE